MSDSSLRVMQVVSDLDVGGAQEVVRTLAENLAAAGCAPVVCTFRDGPLRQEIERLGIPVALLPERRRSVVALPAFLLELWRLRRGLIALLDAHEVDVVQTHLLRSLDFLVLTSRLSRDTLIFWTFQNARFELRAEHLARHGWLLGPKRLGHRLLYRWGARWVSGFIAVSEEVKTAMLATLGGVPAEKIAVIPNSVDMTRYQNGGDRTAVRRELGLGDDDQVVAVVATFKRQKGHTYLLAAAAEVVSRFPALRILLVGDGELRPELEQQARDLGLTEHVHFLGTRHDVPALLAASDCFVLPSLWEGLSMALVEAMASGLPVIATAVSGTNQVVIPGETGLVVPPGQVQPLVAALGQVLSDPAWAAEMGRCGRRRVEREYSARKQAREHIALFERQRRRQRRRSLAPARR